MFFILEKVFTTEDRIRRANEIYQRKQTRNCGYLAGDVDKKNKKIRISLLKRMFIQLVVCSLIYIGIYLIKNSEIVFKSDFIKNIQKTLSYNVDFNNIYLEIKNYIINIQEKVDENEKIEEINIVENFEETFENNIEDESFFYEESVVLEEKTQEELDVDLIVSNHKLVIPASGVITSRFGSREETSIVSGNHIGIDIGGPVGTEIIAAIAGEVSKVSSYGDYGNHIEIVNGDIITRYAHCSEILVEEGSFVKEGDLIAYMGSTGSSTGSHLHFEIHVEDRVLDPELVINF